jgi:hypothetical protein
MGVVTVQAVRRGHFVSRCRGLVTDCHQRSDKRRWGVTVTTA